jgi:hypothetical protein
MRYEEKIVEQDNLDNEAPAILLVGYYLRFSSLKIDLHHPIAEIAQHRHFEQRFRVLQPHRRVIPSKDSFISRG